MDHVSALADRYAIYAKFVRAGIDKTAELGDVDSADLYTEISRSIDKRLWLLEAHLPVEIAAKTSLSETVNTAV